MVKVALTRNPWLRGDARGGILFVVVVLFFLAGCSAAGGSVDAAARVVAVRVGASVHDLVWSAYARALFALTDDRRLAKIDLSEQSSAAPRARTTLSAPFVDRGDDLVADTTHAVVYLPQPKLGRVAVLSDGNLREVGTLLAGPSPSFLALDSGSADLLALSADRSMVTPVDVHNDMVLPSQQVPAGLGAKLEGATRGRLLDYYLSGPGGITHYKGSPGSVQREGEIGISAEQAVGDMVTSSRLYVAEKGTDRLLAVDSQRSGDGLEVVAQAHLGEPVHYLGVDETRVYAATEHRLVVLATNSFEGYHDQIFPIVTTIDFRSALQGEAKQAPLSGLAVGPERVYLALQGQPYVVSVAKPSL